MDNATPNVRLAIPIPTFWKNIFLSIISKQDNLANLFKLSSFQCSGVGYAGRLALSCDCQRASGRANRCRGFDGHCSLAPDAEGLSWLGACGRIVSGGEPSSTKLIGYCFQGCGPEKGCKSAAVVVQRQGS